MNLLKTFMMDNLHTDKQFLDLKFNPSTLSKIQQIYLVSDLHKYENKHET